MAVVESSWSYKWGISWDDIKQLPPSIVLVLSLLISIAIGALVIESIKAYNTSQCTLEEQIINKYREQYGTHSLKCNSELRDSAQRRSEQIASGEIPFSHNGYEDHIDSYYHYFLAGENLAWRFDNYAQVMQGWNDSPTHKDNMLSPIYCDMGVGYADIDTKVWVLHLGCK